MGFPSHVWGQIKNITAGELCKALLRDGWACDMKSGGSSRTFMKSGSPPKRVSIHYHPKKTYGAKMLQGLLDDIGWTEVDLYRLRLVK